MNTIISKDYNTPKEIARFYVYQVLFLRIANKVFNESKIILRLLRKIFYNWVTKFHYWMMRDPKNHAAIEGANIILIGVNLLLISDLIMPNVLGSIATIKFVIPIIILMASVLVWSVGGILKTITGKKLKIPIKYKSLFSLLFIPLLIFINQFLSWIKATNKNYGKQNNINN